VVLPAAMPGRGTSYRQVLVSAEDPNVKGKQLAKLVSPNPWPHQATAGSAPPQVFPVT
jgi:hypothetical protein